MTLHGATNPPHSCPQTLATWDSTLGIDAVEPLTAGCLPRGVAHAVVATYALGDDGLRAGRLCAVAVALLPEARLEPCAVLDGLPGILDVRAAEFGSRQVVVAALADGSVRGFELVVCGNEGGSLENSCRFEVLWVWRCAAASAAGGGSPPIMLSVDIAGGTTPVAGEDALLSACVSDSHGGVHQLRFGINGVSVLGSFTSVHGESAWTCTQLGSNLYSGGDDGVLATWDTRLCNPTEELSPVALSSIPKCQHTITPEFAEPCGDPPVSIRRHRKSHGGVGVTSMIPAPGPGRDNQLLSGGYDDTLRLWDTRSMRSCLSELPCGGGVWRIKPCVADKGGSVKFLLACMYDGFKVATLDKTDAFGIEATYDEHESLAYGAAWLACDAVSEDSPGSKTMCLTGSFYDHSLRLWTP